MEQLNLQAVYDICIELKSKGEDLSKYQVYLGRDDELNGIHTGWYINILDKSEDNSDLLELIAEDCCNVEFREKGILFS